MHNKHLYPTNWPELARACKDRADWRCERCGISHGAERISRAGNVYRVCLMACHKDHHQRHHPDAELICLCAVCHWWLDYELHQLEEWRRIEHMKHQKLITPQRIADVIARSFTRISQYITQKEQGEHHDA